MTEQRTVASDRILYTPSEFAKSALLYLQEIGTLQAKKHHTSRREELSSYLFFLVSDGEGVLKYDGGEFPLKAGDCVFIDCRKKYSHETDAVNLWTLSWIHFSGNAMAEIYGKYLSRGGRAVFHPSDPTDFVEVYRELFAIAGSADYIRDMRINEQLGRLLTLLMKESWDCPDESKELARRDVGPVREYLEEHYREKITLDDLAERFFINKYYLTRIFREQFDTTISAYLLRVRIGHAKRMLRFTDEKVESIGLQCGLGAANYFSRTFKNVEGISPLQYREKW